MFETLVTVTPQQEISKTLTSSKIPFKILNVYFWGNDVYFWGNNVYFWVFSKILGFGDFFLLLGGFWDSVGRGPRGSFPKYLILSEKPVIDLNQVIEYSQGVTGLRESEKPH